MKTITVHIERLVLDGLPVTAAQAGPLQRAIEGELARLIATGGMAVQPSGRAEARIAAPPLRVPARPSAGLLGRGIAHAVHRSIGGGK